MHGIPYRSNQLIRDKEGYPHSIIHTHLWLAHPRNSDFSLEPASQEGNLDICYVNEYRHYIELKMVKDEADNNDHNLQKLAKQRADTEALGALKQIKTNHYSFSFPNDELKKSKLAFYYGVAWTSKCRYVAIKIECDERAKEKPIWEKIKDVSGISIDGGFHKK